MDPITKLGSRYTRTKSEHWVSDFDGKPFPGTLEDEKEEVKAWKSCLDGLSRDAIYDHDIDLKRDVLMQPWFLNISKFWHHKFILFSKIDKGIYMDEQGWFSTTPECIAVHHAFRCGKGVVVNGFSGMGANAIWFAREEISQSTRVIAIDLPEKIKYARDNAAVYGVEAHVDFHAGDFFNVVQQFKGLADTILLSPPLGEVEYLEQERFDIKTMLLPHDGQYLFDVAKKIAPRVVMFLPKNCDLRQLAEVALSATPPWQLEVEENFVNRELKAITAYFTSPSVLAA